MPSTNWDSPGEPPRLHAGASLWRLEWAIGKLEERGVDVPPGCRARYALRLLRHLHEANLQAEPASIRADPTTFATQHRTATELFLIVYAATLCDYDDHPFTREKLETVVRGSDGAEGRHTDPRNKEFELTVAARLCLGGIRVFDGEPDLQFQFGAERWGVAVKRITSTKGKQIKERLRNAVDQIERTSLPGIIAIRLEGRLEGVTVDPNDPQWFEQADAALDEVARYSALYLRSYKVRGLLLNSVRTLATSLNALNQQPVLDTSGPWRYSLFYFPGEDMRPIASFWAQWRARVQAHLDHCLADPPPDADSSSD